MKLFDVYPLFDVNIVKGEGCKVWDDKGNEYLDLYGGHAVISIGHCHPHYVEKVSEQLNKIGFYSNSVKNDLQVQLAERLGRISGYDDYQLFLINSGAEANENALKLASFTNGRTRVLSAEKAFHGRTSLAVEVTNNPKIIAPINDNGHVTYLPLNDLASWEAELQKGDVCAVILECIQGVGGIKMATKEFAQGLQRLCKQYGRTKALSGLDMHVPKGSIYGFVGKNGAGKTTLIRLICGLQFPSAGSFQLYGRNHSDREIDRARRRMGAVVETPAIYGDLSAADNLRMQSLGEYLIEKLKELSVERSTMSDDCIKIQDVRGRGMMIGVDLSVPYKEVRQRLVYEQHCFTGCAGTNILRLLPPLCLSKDEADDFITRLKKAFEVDN